MSKENRYSNIEASVKNEASSYNINKVLVALSGGADSVTCAFALKKIGLEIMALHCNFHLRGEESNRDMTFVRNFCNEQKIPLKEIEFDVEEYLKIHKGESLEMACRKLRHEWFDNQLNDLRYDRIVTGHNADDNIETLFLNMLRGAGTRGLKGMLPDTGKIWRPLLSFFRKEILEYLQINNLNFVVDSTNLKSDYRRNYLRNEIIPLMRNKWSGFDKAMLHTLSHLKEENKIVESSIDKILSRNHSSIPVDEIMDFPAPLLLLKRFIDPLGPFVATPQEVLDAINANKPHIRKWRLKHGILKLRNRRLFIEMSHCESGS